MITSPVRIERRVGQRFSYLLPVSIHQSARGLEGAGFTQDVSSRGLFLFTDLDLKEGAEIEVTLRMPSEITLGEAMPVRCRGRVLRVSVPIPRASSSTGTESKIGVAVRLDGYEYLASDSIPTLNRISPVASPNVGERRFARP
jgi:PilZ domain